MKLVRDNIPQIAPHRRFRKAEEGELLQLVREKLQEELNEVLAAETKQELTEELADLYEVIRKMAQVSRIEWYEVLVEGMKKNVDKGGFEENWVLLGEPREETDE